MKYVDMPLAMWLIFAKSFRNNLTTVLGIEPAKAKEITKKAKRKYKEIIARIPEFEKKDRFKMNLVNCAMFSAFLLTMPTLPDVDGLSLLNENFIIVPKYPEIDNIERSYITIIFDKYIINPQNPDFKYSTVRFEVVCPYSEWIVDEGNLRPYLLM